MRGQDARREAAGHGLDKQPPPASPGAARASLHGNKTYLLQDDDGQIAGRIRSAPGRLSWDRPRAFVAQEIGRSNTTSATDAEALDAFQLLCRPKASSPALEPSHAIAAVKKVAPTMDKDAIILATCRRGDKDIFTVAGTWGSSCEA